MAADSLHRDAANVLMVLASVANALAPVTGGGWTIALRGLGGLAQLTAELITKHDIDPQEAIAVWRSVGEDLERANERIEDLIRSRSG